MKIRLFSAMALLTFAVSGQSLHKKGVILDSMAVEGSIDESYSLYLPESLNTDAPSAIVFIFDPAARGRSGILPFVESAEKYQLILACSNNSRNTAYAENFAIADRWFKDVFSKFDIDQNKIYGAGFSGGSRLISAIGVLSGAFKGIIGCGAAFSGNSGQIPYASDHFLYAGLVGTRDMNYQEMYEAGSWLDRIELPNTIISYEDDHRWPASEYVLQAFEWFQFQDIIKSGPTTDTDLLDSYISEQLMAAEELLSTNQLIPASEIYERLARISEGSTSADSIKKKSKELKKSKEYKKALKLRGQITAQEKEWTNKLVGRIRQEIDSNIIPDNFNWWSRELGRLNALDQDENKEVRDMGHRLRSMIFAVAIENFDLSLAQKNEFEIDYYSKFLLVNWPDNAFVHFRIASGYARLGKEDDALTYLESAIENGWTNLEWIRANPAFKNLKNNPKFIRLLE